jgi:hypothetical protein
LGWRIPPRLLAGAGLHPEPHAAQQLERADDQAARSAVSSHDLADALFMTALSALTGSRSLLGFIAALPSK